MTTTQTQRWECMDNDGFGGLFCYECAVQYATEQGCEMDSDSSNANGAYAHEDIFGQHEYRECDSCGKD